ncbi:MFS transporter [Ramlibacter sp. H39-3-26]|uniref:MFS transporter n=1 Tax=Curvibacter soli TaxID=3031331 RepID=UPI0031F4752B
MSPVSPTAGERPAAAMPPGLVILVLALLLGIQPITTDIYLPALPQLTEGLGTTVSQAQLTLSALMLAFGVSQLAWGPLSDRFGRRPILLWGVAAYTFASLGCVLAPGIGAAVMCGRAIVCDDLYQPCGQSGVVGPFPRAAGTASARNGFFMMLTACAWTLVQQHGEPRD